MLCVVGLWFITSYSSYTHYTMPAGLELSLALRARWNDLLNGKLSVTLVTLNNTLLPEESEACQEALKQVMQKYNINVLHSCSVEKVTSTHVIINSDETSSRSIEYTQCIWATGAGKKFNFIQHQWSPQIKCFILFS